MSNDSPTPSSNPNPIPNLKPNSVSVSDSHSYPKPEAEFQEIIQNPDTFFDKLQSFHLRYGIKFRVPTLGGNRLDLHRLFLEVTSRGGIEKVIKDRRWKEVTGAFKFPSTITSASFVLRRYYLSLLYHFEQVYYFRKKEPYLAAYDQSSKGANGTKLPLTIDEEASSKQLAVIPDLGDGSLVTGTIDGKFESGYLVTVTFGSEVLKGVIYENSTEANKSKGFSSFREPAHRHHRKHQSATRDPSHPKRNRSGYTFFFAEQYHMLRPLYHGQERAISKRIGQLWSGLTEAEKLVYQEKGLRDRERYKAEMLEYKSSQHASPPQ
ncbi:high mobility group B protein 10-like [Andrographis paniculata]|uniref:high mobility group B protein 10-like n=1 Tax=Andrographis paniculata TaxID=175694 RepID=UPI0021E96D91|nr:high mobility group B protein 10-like [Andrographis paniculata]